MARKADSGWRDGMLATWHSSHGFTAPAAGMTLPMIEYDRGHAVGLVSYHKQGTALPQGAHEVAAHSAFGNLYAGRDGGQLPFLTAVYDARDWAFKVFPHNDAARLLVGTGWQALSEREFATVLYRMRCLPLPDLSRYGVEWNSTVATNQAVARIPQPAERWPGEAMSARRRAYEPVAQMPFKQRIPCLDVDFAVVDVDDRVALLVDYKRSGSGRDEKHNNMKALASLTVRRELPIAGYPNETVDRTQSVAALVAEYAPVETGWELNVYPLNTAARSLLSFALGHTGADVKLLADAIAGDGWLSLSQQQWLDVLRCARDL